MVVRRGRYKKVGVKEALDRAYKGEKFAVMAQTSSVLLQTLFKKSKELHTTGAITEKRRGSKLALSAEQETNLVTWISGMELAGFPVGAVRVVERANKVYEKLRDVVTHAGTLFKPLIQWLVPAA
uniref:HTH CENPB-type domain-containing protein n=1 Tax=Phytophthora ramorum TaxID=164328 RepID=H3H585_PHYRM